MYGYLPEWGVAAFLSVVCRLFSRTRGELGFQPHTGLVVAVWQFCSSQLGSLSISSRG